VSRRQSSTRAENRHRALLAEMAEIGWTLPGSITERHTRCSNPTCRCRADPPQLHGPYSTWTRKVDNTTVTRNLTAEQAERYRPWIANARRLRELRKQLEDLSILAMAEADRSGEPSLAGRSSKVISLPTVSDLLDTRRLNSPCYTINRWV